MPHPRIVDLVEVVEDYSPADQPEDRVRTAQALIEAAIAILAEVARETRDRYAEAYMIDQLRVLVSDDHGFLCRGFTLDRWIERLEVGEGRGDPG